MKYVLFFVLFTASSLSAQLEIDHLDQPVTPKNEVSLEWLGTGGLYSLNYERLLFQKERFDFKARAGVGWMPVHLGDFKFASFNIEGKVVYNIRRSAIEFGLGYSLLHFYDDRFEDFNEEDFITFNMLSARVGYRIYNKKKQRYWGFSFTPFIPLKLSGQDDDVVFDEIELLPYFGISHGIRF